MANAPYIEEMQAEYERNPGAVSDEWRRFFESLKEAPLQNGHDFSGPSWAAPLDLLTNDNEADADLAAALTGRSSQGEHHIRERITQCAYASGFEMSPAWRLCARPRIPSAP